MDRYRATGVMGLAAMIRRVRPGRPARGGQACSPVRPALAPCARRAGGPPANTGGNGCIARFLHALAASTGSGMSRFSSPLRAPACGGPCAAQAAACHWILAFTSMTGSSVEGLAGPGRHHSMSMTPHRWGGGRPRSY